MATVGQNERLDKAQRFVRRFTTVSSRLSSSQKGLLRIWLRHACRHECVQLTAAYTYQTVCRCIDGLPMTWSIDGGVCEVIANVDVVSRPHAGEAEVVVICVDG